MDTHITKIGSKYNGARRGNTNDRSIMAANKIDVVDFYTRDIGNTGDGALVYGGAPKNLLKRFSRMARELLKQESGNPTTPITTATASTIVSANTGPQRTKLYLNVPSALLPCKATLDIVIEWMRINRSSKINEPVTPLLPPKPEESTIVSLVELYAAGKLLNILPMSALDELHTMLLNRITTEVSDVSTVEMLYIQLPLNHGLISRMINAYYDHHEAGLIDDEADAKIYAFTDRHPDLDRRFQDVHAHRQRVRREEEKRRARQCRRARQQYMQKKREEANAEIEDRRVRAANGLDYLYEEDIDRMKAGGLRVSTK
ncbi:hypothetical protein H2203_006261 [Taxawa tesnikishii (nom. ined.)]|nr:hypothetical protein H2203_006261 [Dothideales sp. JES 119]